MGRFVALGGVLLVAGAVGTARAQWGGFAPWWQAAAAVLAAALVGLGALWTVLPAGAARRAAWGLPVLSLLLLASWTVARTRAGLGADTGPWVWRLEPVGVAFAALAWPLPVAAAYAPASALAVLLADVGAGGHPSRALLAASLTHLGIAVVVLVLASARHRLAALRQAMGHAAADEARRVRAHAEEAERSRLASVVHDEVLATLTVAAQTPGPSSPSLAAQARRALAVALGTAAGPDDEPLPARDLVATLSSRVHRLAPAIVVRARVEPVDVPSHVADAVIAALEEALRNSLRHAGGPARLRPVSRRVDVTVDRGGLRVVASDDGVGFDVDALDPRRLGVRRSILERMAAVPGTTARVSSQPGAGTRVDLGWRRP